MRTLSLALFTVLTALMLVPSAGAQDATDSKFRKAWQRVQRREAMAEARQRGQKWAQQGQKRQMAAQANKQGRRQAVAKQRRPGQQGRKVASAKQRNNVKAPKAMGRNARPNRPMNTQRPMQGKGQGKVSDKPVQRMTSDANPRGIDKRPVVAPGKVNRTDEVGAKQRKVAAARTRKPGMAGGQAGAGAKRPGKWQGGAKRPVGANGAKGPKGKAKVAQAKPAPNGAMKARWAKKQSKGDRAPSKADIKKAPKKSKSAASLLRSKDK